MGQAKRNKPKNKIQNNLTNGGITFAFGSRLCDSQNKFDRRSFILNTGNYYRPGCVKHFVVASLVIYSATIFFKMLIFLKNHSMAILSKWYHIVTLTNSNYWMR